MTPARAAELLAALPARQQTDVVERLSALGEADVESVQVVAQELAAWLYACTYTAHGRCVLQCEWCSDHEVVVDGDGVSFPADTDALVRLIEHARYGHGSPRSVIVKLYRDALHTSQLDELLAESVECNCSDPYCQV